MNYNQIFSDLESFSFPFTFIHTERFLLYLLITLKRHVIFSVYPNGSLFSLLNNFRFFVCALRLMYEILCFALVTEFSNPQFENKCCRPEEPNPL